MASILKVDQLQKPDGSTPTAADLGIDVAGSVVQVVQGTYNTQTEAADVEFDTGIQLSITPKYAGSDYILMASVPTRRYETSNSSIGMSLTWYKSTDGGSVWSEIHTRGPNHREYTENDSHVFSTAPVQASGTFASTDTHLFKIRAHPYSIGNSYGVCNGGMTAVFYCLEIKS